MALRYSCQQGMQKGVFRRDEMRRKKNNRQSIAGLIQLRTNQVPFLRSLATDATKPSAPKQPAKDAGSSSKTSNSIGDRRRLDVHRI